MSRILTRRSTLGPLPTALQKVTSYIAAVGAKAAQPNLARRFLDVLKTPEVRAGLAKAGFMGEKS